MAWSKFATQKLIDDIQERFEKKLKHAEKAREIQETVLDSTRNQWKDLVLQLSEEIERLKTENHSRAEAEVRFKATTEGKRNVRPSQ